MQIRLSIPNEMARLADLNAALDAVLQRHGLDATVREDVRLIAEEVVCNAINHGAEPDARLDIMVALQIRAGRLELEFRDDGRAFDPLSQPVPELDADICDRPVGGLGVHLIRELAEHLSYVRCEPYNLLRVILRLPESESTP